MFGLTFDKLVLLAVLAALLIGPERLPGYAARLGRLTRGVRDAVDAGRTRATAEFADVSGEEWRRLDPRQYDPRRIIREALEPETAPAPPTAAQDPEPSLVAPESPPAPPRRAGSDGRFRRPERPRSELPGGGAHTETRDFSSGRPAVDGVLQHGDDAVR